MIKPSDAIIDPGIDAFFKKAEKDAEKELNEKALKDYINYIFGHHVDTDSVLKEVEKWKKRDEEKEESWKKWDDKWEKFMNKPTTPIKIFFSQPMQDNSVEELEIRSEMVQTYVKGILVIHGYFSKEYTDRIQFIDNIHHEELDADAGRLMHLGRSIQQMQDADLVIFDKDYFGSEGCLVEEKVCKEYEIPKTYITCVNDANAFECDLISWFKNYLDNENVSK